MAHGGIRYFEKMMFLKEPV
jgi:glycerol-3-phosphate dehydrogenase